VSDDIKVVEWDDLVKKHGYKALGYHMSVMKQPDSIYIPIITKLADAQCCYS
jgi:hypothetical protein